MIPTSKLFALGLAVFLSPIPHIWADTAILVALPSEQDAIRREVRLVGQTVDLAGHRVSVGYRKGEKLYIVRTGAGNLNSAMVTEGLIAKYRVDRVISIGVAGSLAERMKDEGGGMKVGDILIATNVVSHQAGKETPAGFETQKESSAVSRQLSAEYVKRCQELRRTSAEVTTEICRQTTDGPQRFRSTQNDTNTVRNSDKLKGESRQPAASLRTGRLVSGDSFIASSAKRNWLRETYHADAVDMVSAGIAHVC
jgi:nucleoside phosphorylase